MHTESGPSMTRGWCAHGQTSTKGGADRINPHTMSRTAYNPVFVVLVWHMADAFPSTSNSWVKRRGRTAWVKNCCDFRFQFRPSEKVSSWRAPVSSCGKKLPIVGYYGGSALLCSVPSTYAPVITLVEFLTTRVCLPVVRHDYREFVPRGEHPKNVITR